MTKKIFRVSLMALTALVVACSGPGGLELSSHGSATAHGYNTNINGGKTSCGTVTLKGTTYQLGWAMVAVSKERTTVSIIATNTRVFTDAYTIEAKGNGILLSFYTDIRMTPGTTNAAIPSAYFEVRLVENDLTNDFYSGSTSNDMTLSIADGAIAASGNLNVSDSTDGTAPFAMAIDYTGPATILPYPSYTTLNYTGWTGPTSIVGGNSKSNAATLASSDHWYTDELISVSKPLWYKVSVTAGHAYAVAWDDALDGSYGYDGALALTIYSSDGTTILNGIELNDHGYTGTPLFTPSSGTVYVKVGSYDAPHTTIGVGNFAIGWHEVVEP